MMLKKLTILLFLFVAINRLIMAQDNVAHNPILYADVPDMSMIRVGDTYYMSSTTMHMAPGVPIMKSNDLVNWEIVNYAYDTLGDVDALTLTNGKSAYGSGSWASCIRYHNGTYYVSTFAKQPAKPISIPQKTLKTDHGKPLPLSRLITITAFSLMMTGAFT